MKAGENGRELSEKEAAALDRHYNVRVTAQLIRETTNFTKLMFENGAQISGELYIDGHKAILPANMPRTQDGYLDYLEKLFRSRFPLRYSTGTNVTIRSQRASKSKALINAQVSPRDKSKWQPSSKAGYQSSI